MKERGTEQKVNFIIPQNRKILYFYLMLYTVGSSFMCSGGKRAHAAAVNDKNIVGSHKYAINISNGRYQCNKKKLL